MSSCARARSPTRPCAALRREYHAGPAADRASSALGPRTERACARHALTRRACAQFQDIRQFQELSVIVFGGTVISDATDVDGNTGSTWNYGSNFGGGTGSPTDHSWPGTWGVVDTAYSTYDTSYGLTTQNANIALCPGTAGSVCAG